MIARAAALAFGVMKTTDLLKELFLRATGMDTHPYLKSTVAMALSGAVAIVYEDDWKDRLLLAASVAGGSAVLHEGYAVLSTGADRNKVLVLQNAARAARNAPRPSGGPGHRVPPLG